MFTLIRNADVHAPDHLGKRDILICGPRIVAIAEDLMVSGLPDCRVVDVGGRIVAPGFVDGHVHLIGGGGEGGFHTRTPEVDLTALTTGGITTVVGLLGTDALARHPETLYAKARGLTNEGVSAYMFTGGYKVPSPTITGAVDRDVAFIDRVLGAKVAISDHRGSQPTREELARLASQARVGGILAGKAGCVVAHLGNGAARLDPLREVIATTEVPRRQFIPTHVNRGSALLEDAVKWGKSGGYMDFTCFASASGGPERSGPVKTSAGIARCLKEGVALELICMSSDGNGSQPLFDARGNLSGIGVAGFDGLLRELGDLVGREGVPLETALRPITRTPAEALGLSPRKGVLASGGDADLLILNGDMSIDRVYAMGRVMVENGEAVAHGTFSNEDRRNHRHE